MEIRIGQLRAEAVRILNFHFTPAPKTGANGVAAGFALQACHKEAIVVFFVHLGAVFAAQDFGRFCLREHRPDLPALLAGIPAGGMRPQNPKRVAVISPNNRFNLFRSHERLKQVWPIS